MVNGALDAFVRAAAIELPRGIRINSVSPTAVAESMPKIGQLFAGFRPVTAADAALGYVRSVEGGPTGPRRVPNARLAVVLARQLMPGTAKMAPWPPRSSASF